MEGVPIHDLPEYILIQKSETDYSQNSKNNTEHKWNGHNTKMLIHMYGKFKKFVGTSKVKTMKKLWELIAIELTKELNADVSPQHCENRWRVLHRSYKKYLDNKNKIGSCRRYFEFANEMDELFSKRKNVRPVILLCSDTNLKTQFKCDLNETKPEIVASTTPTSQGMTTGNVAIQDSTRPVTPSTSAPTISKNREEVQLKKEIKSKDSTRNSIFENMRKDKLEYQKEKLKLMQERNEIEKQKLQELKRQNDILQIKYAVKSEIN